MPCPLIAAGLLTALTALSAEPYGDLKGLEIRKPEDRQDVPSVPPPAGAVMLLDGKSLEGWTAKDGKAPAKWKLVGGGVVQAGGGDILSRRLLDGDFLLHVEFRVPYQPDQRGQARGNSGVNLQGRYEVQVLDSYGIEKPEMGDCGAIYGVRVPSVNAARAPTVWQSYDIEFRAPRFQAGKKTEPARMTVTWNGVKVHDQVPITTDNTTAGLGGDPARPGPLLLQDHGCPVQFRNIWLLERKVAAADR